MQGRAPREDEFGSKFLVLSLACKSPSLLYLSPGPPLPLIQPVPPWPHSIHTYVVGFKQINCLNFAFENKLFFKEWFF